MKKARFIRNALKELEMKAKEMKAKGKINGNALNKVIKDIEAKSYESGFFDTGEISKHTKCKDGSSYKIQNSPNWREIFTNYIK